MKVYCIQSNNEFDLVKKINESKKDVKATQPMQKKDGSWVAFIYYNEQGQNQVFSTSKIEDSNVPAYTPTKEQLERWRTIKPTKKTKELLKKRGFSDLEIEQIKSQLDAHKLLE